MRLLSQGKMHDVPYDHAALSIRKTGKTTYIISADVIGDDYVIMGEYDSLEKCRKVMAMFRTQYESSCELFFQFPENEEVKV